MFCCFQVMRAAVRNQDIASVESVIESLVLPAGGKRWYDGATEHQEHAVIYTNVNMKVSSGKITYKLDCKCKRCRL